jgi:hypothetical protein
VQNKEALGLDCRKLMKNIHSSKSANWTEKDKARCSNYYKIYTILQESKNTEKLPNLSDDSAADNPVFDTDESDSESDYNSPIKAPLLR